jgi:hypothetical protein
VEEGVRELKMSGFEVLLGSASALLSGLAAYFAWQNYWAYPKLKLFVGDEANKIHYEEKRSKGWLDTVLCPHNGHRA